MSVRWPSARRSMLLPVIGLIGLVGCSSATRDSRSVSLFGRSDFATLRLPDADLQTVSPVARRAFDLEFAIDPAESTNNLWVSRAIEVTDRREPERVRDVLGASDRRQRRIAYLQLYPEDTFVVVRCRVLRQRLDTAERAAFNRSRGFDGDDRPSDTPIERTGATSTDRREEWTHLSRDRQAERRLLDAIARGLAADGPDG